MQTKKVRVVGRSVTALAMGLALTVGSASLASADGHSGSAAKGHDVDASSVVVHADNQNDARGVITAMTSSSVTVLNSDGASTTFTFAPTATFKEGDATILESALAIGQSVHVDFNSTAPTTALAINVKLSDASGRVTLISGNTITIAGHEGTTSTVVVSPTATTYTNEGGTAATFANVIVGAKISARGTLSPDKSTLNASSVTIDSHANPTPAVADDATQDESQSDQSNQGNNGDQGASVSVSIGENQGASVSVSNGDNQD